MYQFSVKLSPEGNVSLIRLMYLKQHEFFSLPPTRYRFQCDE